MWRPGILQIISNHIIFTNQNIRCYEVLARLYTVCIFFVRFLWQSGNKTYFVRSGEVHL